ncbi:MAG: hypothetical protein IJB69_04775 [Clostridia bacterium]|nr:hypothetical protein [Clostridia bacterium]
MTFARKMMKFAGMLLTAALLFGLCCNALAVSDPVEFTIQVTPDSLTAPGDVQVSLRVANTGSTDMKDPVTLYDPAGNVVASFGDGGSYILSAGAFRTWEGTWKMTDEQLNAGEVVYTLKYHLEDDNGDLIAMNATASAPVAFTGERVNLSVNRTVSPEVVRSGKEVTVTYELYNSGNVDISDVRVKEAISRTAQKVDKLQAGEKKTLTFTAKLGNADLTSSATITFKAGDDKKTQTLDIAEQIIPKANPNLKIEIASPSTGVNIGEAARLQVTFTNAGNVSYSNVSVTDQNKGEIFTNLSIPAGATVTEEKEFILTEKTTFKVTATLPDNTGETKALSSNELTVGVFDPEKTLLLTLNLTADQENVQKTPADVRFTLSVTNNSNIKAENITVKHGETAICEIDALEAGQSKTIVRDVRISQAGKFRFTATAKDTMNNEVSFDSNTLQLAYAPATPAPTVEVRATVVPPKTVTPAPVDPVLYSTRNALMTVAGVLAVLFGIAFILFAVSTVMRIKNKNKSKNAYDHLELSERRDYTEPAEEAEEDNQAPVMVVEENTAEPLPVDEKPAGDGEGGWRISRPAEEEDAPQARHAVQPAAQTEEEE